MLGVQRGAEAHIGQLLRHGPGRGRTEMNPHEDSFHEQRRAEVRVLAEAVDGGNVAPSRSYRGLSAANPAHVTSEVRGKSGWTDTQYIEFATRYVELLRDGARNPILQLTQEPMYTPARIRQAITHARQQEWLITTPPRKAGGTLTDPALAIMKHDSGTP